MSDKRILIEIPSDLWRRMKEAAAREGRPVKEAVANALRLYLTNPPMHGTQGDPLLEPTRADALWIGQSETPGKKLSMEDLRAQVNQQVPGAGLKTARELERERIAARERRRGDESGSQAPDDEGDPF